MYFFISNFIYLFLFLISNFISNFSFSKNLINIHLLYLKSLGHVQLFPHLCPMDYTIHGILQARILEWVALPFSRGSSQPRNQTGVFCLQVDSLPTELSGKPLLCLKDYYNMNSWTCRNTNRRICDILFS